MWWSGRGVPSYEEVPDEGLPRAHAETPDGERDNTLFYLKLFLSGMAYDCMQYTSLVSEIKVYFVHSQGPLLLNQCALEFPHAPS